jgi:hypothetical protein
MKRQSFLRAIAGLAVVGSAFWYGSIRAQGAPPTQAPVLYSGYIEDTGVPVNGSKSIGLNLWSSTDTSTTANRACQQAAVATPVTNGWFSVQLGSACLDVMRRYPALYLQFVVDSVAFPLQTIGAVPYSVRALEYNSGSRLRKIFRTAADGAKEADPSRWFDSLRNEECQFRITSAQGQPVAGICVPYNGASSDPSCVMNGAQQYSDGACSTAFTPPSGTSSTTPPKYVVSSTASSGIATPGTPVEVYCLKASNGCCALVGTCALMRTIYPVGTDLPATDFVSWSENHD